MEELEFYIEEAKDHMDKSHCIMSHTCIGKDPRWQSYACHA
jgi:hypothetical protein